MTSDESFMKQAVKQAKKAYDKLETPIGCVIVHEDKIIARGYNKRNMKKNTLAHPLPEKKPPSSWEIFSH